MASLADRQAADGTPFIELPVVRIYNAQGQRLKLAPLTVSPRFTATELDRALETMIVDTSAPTLSEDLAVLEDGAGGSFGQSAALPAARAYIVHYGAEWCRTSKPFEAALAQWQSGTSDVVVIRAGANFGGASPAR